MVALVAGPSTKETFVTSAIENGRVYLVKQSHLARAYHGLLRMQPIPRIISTSPWMGSESIAGLLSHHCILHALGGEKLCRVKVHCLVCNTIILPLVQAIMLHWLSKWENGAQDIQLVMADLWL